MSGAVFTLSREIREAAQIESNSGMLCDLVLETAGTIDGLMSDLKGELADYRTRAAAKSAPTTRALDSDRRPLVAA